jgi:hypothetical protein
MGGPPLDNITTIAYTVLTNPLRESNKSTRSKNKTHFLDRVDRVDLLALQSNKKASPICHSFAHYVTITIETLIRGDAHKQRIHTPHTIMDEKALITCVRISPHPRPSA